MFWLRKVMRDFWLQFAGNQLLLYSTFIGMCLDLQNVKPIWLKHLCIEHWWFVRKVNCSMNWKTSAPFCGIVDTQKVLFKLPSLRKLRFTTVNQKKDRKSAQFTWSSLGLAKFLWILKSKPRLLSIDVTMLLNLALFFNEKNFACNSYRCSTLPSTKYNRISIRVPLWLSVRGSNFPKISGQN